MTTPVSPARSLPARWIGLDVGRGFAALAVFAFHGGIGKTLADKLGHQEFEWLDIPGATLAVPFFFALSGFVISWAESPRLAADPFQRKTLLAYLRRRFWRIYPPYVSALIIGLVATRLQGDPIEVADVIAHLGLWNVFVARWFNSINLALWSIPVEFFYYLLFPFWLLLRRQTSLAVAAGAVALVTAASFGVTAHFHETWSHVDRFFLNSWCGWLAGAQLADWVRRQSTPLPWDGRHWAGVTATLAAFLFFRLNPASPFCLVTAFPVAVLLGVWAVYALARMEPVFAGIRSGWRLRLLGLGTTLGSFSYSLYLIHAPVLIFGTVLLRSLPPSLLRSVLTAGWLGVVLVAAWLHYRWVERPSQQRGSSARRAKVSG